jgi:hypothetical protein
VGSIYGYGAALSVGLFENLSFGISGMLIKGSTNDFQSKLGRGTLVFYSSYFRVDSVDYKNSYIGTSDYNGAEFNFSGMYKSGSLTLGFSIKPPTTITRKYQYNYQKDTSGISSSAAVTGSDKITLPWRGTFGLSVSVQENLRAVIEYELRPMGVADYINSGVTSNPWRSSHLLHLGAEYSPFNWLTIRGGYSDKAEVFEEEGNPFPGDPVYSTILSCGVGLNWQNLKVNITYEYFNVKYDDLLQDAVFLNSAENNYIVTEISYNFNL